MMFKKWIAPFAKMVEVELESGLRDEVFAVAYVQVLQRLELLVELFPEQ